MTGGAGGDKIAHRIIELFCQSQYAQRISLNGQLIRNMKSSE